MGIFNWFANNDDKKAEDEQTARRIIDEAARRNKIIRDFGACIERDAGTGSTFSILDVSALPHPKTEIRDAIYKELLLYEDDETQRGLLKFGAIELANYQEDVGQEPLSMIGANFSQLKEIVEQEPDSEKLVDFIEKMKDPSKEAKYDSFSKIKEEERSEINGVLARIEIAREQLQKEGKL